MNDQKPKYKVFEKNENISKINIRRVLKKIKHFLYFKKINLQIGENIKTKLQKLVEKKLKKK